MMKSERPFDCVRLMRELRDQLDRRVSPMTPHERVEFINENADQAARELGLPEAIDPRVAAERARVVPPASPRAA